MNNEPIAFFAGVVAGFGLGIAITAVNIMPDFRELESFRRTAIERGYAEEVLSADGSKVLMWKDVSRE